METVELSSKYEIAIPEKIRETPKLSPGQKLHLRVANGSLQVYVRPLEALRGAAHGIQWKGDYRDRNDRY
jgi:bifunctional DNA-binding transcriptional regulator/antitoxin component of YhaV-PrlF toxin-antitoxin module